jgi:hypothetical protein
MDLIVIDGDAAVFEAQFGAAMVDVQDGTMVGSGHGTIDGAPICVEGDEASVIVGPVPYSTPTHSTKGAGLLTIDSLGSDQLASQTTTGDAKVILVGTKFNAKFAVSVPAQQPGTPPVPDNNTEYAGFGSFETANEAFRGN